MIGLIVTGHGSFATGISEGLKVIAGDGISDYEYVDFLGTDSTEQLEEKLKLAFENLSHCDGILVLADLIGGSPFKIGVTLGIERGNAEVVGGVNVAMLVEVNMMRQFQEDLDMLTQTAIHTGKSMIDRFVYVKYVENEEEDEL